MRTPTALLLLTLGLISCKKDEPVPPAKPVEVARPTPAPRPAPVAAATGARTIAMEVTDDGFVPANVKLKAGEPIVLVVTRKTDETCAKDLLIEGTDIKQELPLNKAVEIAWTPKAAGQVKFGCAMGMMIGGVLLVE